MEVTEVMEKVGKKPMKSKQPGEREDAGHYFCQSIPRSHQIRLVSSRLKHTEGGGSSYSVKL